MDIANSQVLIQVPYEQRQEELSLLRDLRELLAKVANNQVPEIMNIAQAATYTGLDKQTLRKKISDGILINDPDPITSQPRFLKSDLDRKKADGKIRFKAK
jgi:hypothetical protein